MGGEEETDKEARTQITSCLTVNVICHPKSRKWREAILEKQEV